MTRSITCPRCGRTSFNPNDIEQRYCGNCHRFHDHTSTMLFAPAELQPYEWHRIIMERRWGEQLTLMRMHWG